MTVQSNAPSQLQVQADSENYAGWDDQESGTAGGRDPNKRLNRLRSVKLSKVRSFKQSRRWVNSRSHRLSSNLSGNRSARQNLSLTPMSDASPNYMKSTSCSSARKEIPQASPRNSESCCASFDPNWGNSNHGKPNAVLSGQQSARPLTRRSSFKPMKGLTRMSSLRVKRPLVKKYSGGTDAERKLKKSKSIKLAGFESSRPPTGRAKNQPDRPPAVFLGDAANRRRPYSIRSPSEFQASPHNSRSGSSGNGPKRRNWIILNPNSGSDQKPLVRKTSLRPVRILTKTLSLKPRRPTVRKHDSATCSSTLKHSNFPDPVELHPGESESERISVMKVCPYKYCSLNGHCHAPLPPLKSFLVRRRRKLKTQKTMKRHFSGLEKEIQAYKMAFNLDTGSAGSPSAEKSGEEFFVEICAQPTSKSTGEGTYDGDGEAKRESETSYPQISIVENPSQLTDFQTETCLRKEMNESVSEIPDREWKEEGNIAFNLENESENSNLIDDQPVSVVFHSLEAEDPGFCNKPFSMLDDSGSTSRPEGVVVCGNVLQEINEESVSILNSAFNEGGSESNDDKPDDLNGVASSASGCSPLQKLPEGCEEKDGVSEPDYGDSELPCDTDEAIGTQLEKQKFVRMWRLIYQHVVSETDAKFRSQLSLDGALREKHDDAESLISSDSCGDFTETNQDMEDHGADCQRSGLCQMDAVKLVEEVIDGIILPETPENLSDDNAVTSDIISDQELLGTDHGEDKELSISASCNPAGFQETEAQSGVADQEESLLKDDNATVQVHEKTICRVEDKPSQKLHRSSWSNLKKVILWKRFMKAVEKVRKFNPREPRYLPLEPKPEAEKVFLRHQEMEGRKNAEEWMLDYALQQFVSRLTPDRRRKVALLVEAFEAISPLQDTESPLNSTVVARFHSKPVQSGAGSSGKSKEAARKENDGKDHPSTLLGAEVHLKGCAEQNSTSLTRQHDFADSSLLEIKDSRLCDKFVFNKGESTCYEEVQVEGKILQEVNQEIVTSIKSEGNGKNGSSEPLGMDKGSIQEDFDKAVSSTSVCNSLAEQPLVNEKVIGIHDSDNEYLQANPSPEASEPEPNSSPAYRTQMDQQRYNRMWYLIYQHMVSGIGANAEILPILTDANKTLPEGASVTDHDESCEETEFHQIDAIKLVQEAIDQMISPQSEDHSLDDSSSTSDITSEEKLLRENQVEGRELNVSASNSCDEDRLREFNDRKLNHGKMENAEEVGIKPDNITTPEEEKIAPKLGNKSDRPVSKNWSHLKKLILLKRFVKSLEKVKRFNPRGPRFLALEPDPEAEKVRLRHQTTGDRKNSEEWMLDFALQQVVTKLSPARRRRVELLVEAFETVTPPSQIESQKRHNGTTRATTWPLR